MIEIGNLPIHCYVRKEGVMLKKLLARFGSYTGYALLIGMAIFYLIALVAIIILALYAFTGGA